MGSSYTGTQAQERSFRVACFCVMKKEAIFVLISFLSILHATGAFSETRGARRQTRPNVHQSPSYQRQCETLVNSSPTWLLSAVNGEISDASYSDKANGGVFNEMDRMRRHVISLLRDNDVVGALSGIVGMMNSMERVSDDRDKSAECELIDNALQSYFNYVFAPPYGGRSSLKRVSLGLRAMELQLSSSKLKAPFNTIPKKTMLSALKALTCVNEVKQEDSIDGALPNTDAAYRILQRLVTGAGVRNADPRRMRIHESDFNMVLNAYSNLGRMDMAHRIVALQQRTPHAPPLSPVAYSILIKGYGKLSDLGNVEMILAHAESSRVEPDTVMMNSLIDAYVNCNSLEKAREVFEWMRNPNELSKQVVTNHQTLFSKSSCPRPNRRTYNTFLKGLATNGMLEESIALSREMEERRMWDDVTTNTLVQGAILALDFSLAENILDNYTASKCNPNTGRHPNVEAYTSLLDGYAKAGDLDGALATMKLMNERGVEPNEVTYTCMVGALARHKKIDQAKKMAVYMKSTGLQLTAITYNSFISGLVSKEYVREGENFDTYVDEAIKLLRQMIQQGIRPNTVTVSVLVDAFGRCDQPRVTEAKALVSRLEIENIIPANSTRVATALVQVCGVGEDLKGALAYFRSIQNPDVAAVNSFLDACNRCNRDKLAVETFDHYFRSETRRLEPDVISYSSLISAVLKKSSTEGASRARQLYEEMNRMGIMADTALVDIILKAMINYGRISGIQKADVRFIAGVVRDAEKLAWGEGQFERRKRAIQSVIGGRVVDAWKDDSDLYGLLATGDTEDELFRRHGWNKVDSGFRLWGGSAPETRKPPAKKDDFLQSKGWNNVDSGFRII